MDETPLLLSGRAPLFEGMTRRCYAHPDDPSRLVKVFKPGATPEDRRRLTRRRYRRIMPLAFHDVQRREWETYRHLERRIGRAVQPHIPRLHGIVPTDLGPGLVMDLARSADGTPCLSFEEQLRGGERQETVESLDRLLAFAAREGLVISDRNTGNVVFTRDAAGRLDAGLVDGFGSLDMVPLWRWSDAFARFRARHYARKMRREIAAAIARHDAAKP